MSDQLTEPTQTIIKQSQTLRKIANEDRLKPTALDEALTALHRLEGALKRFIKAMEELATKKEPLIPAIDEAQEQLLRTTNELEQKRQLIWKYYLIFRNNHMVTRDEHANLPQLLKTTIILIDKALEQENTLRLGVNETEKEIQDVKEELSNPHRLKKLQRAIKKIFSR